MLARTDKHNSKGQDKRVGKGQTHRALLALAVWGVFFSQAPTAKAQSFAVCTDQPTLTRPGVTDSWDTYWWEGSTYKSMTFSNLNTVSQADAGKTMFETMHSPSVFVPNGGNSYWALEPTGFKATEPYTPPGIAWTGPVFKDPDFSTLYYFYHTEVGEGGPCAPAEYAGIATSTNGGHTWTDRGLYTGGNLPLICDGLWQGQGAPTVAYERGYYYIFLDNIGGGAPTDKANQGLIAARISLADMRGADPSGHVYFYNGSAPGGAWNLNTVTTTGTNFVNNVRPASGYLVTTSWRTPGSSYPAPYNFGAPVIHWNYTLNRYVMKAERFTGNHATTHATPALIVHSAKTLAYDPLSWSPFAAFRDSDGNVITGKSASDVRAPGIASEYYMGLVSPDTGTEKDGYDMRLFSTPGSIGSETSTRLIKFGTGSTPPTCGSGGYSVTLPLSLNQNRFQPGDTLRLALQAGNTGPGLSADFYFGILLPDGVTAVFLTSLSPLTGVTARIDGNPQAFKALAADAFIPQGLNVTLNDVIVFTFSGNEPPGTYVLFAAFTLPGAFTDGRVDAGDILAIYSKAFTVRAR